LQSRSNEINRVAKTSLDRTYHTLIQQRHFFDHGGYSLMATQLISRVRSCFGVELALGDFFADPTIQNLAELVEEEILANADSNQIDELLALLEKSAGESAQTVMLTE
jgi:surfactin family lipopeptide synthetase C